MSLHWSAGLSNERKIRFPFDRINSEIFWFWSKRKKLGDPRISGFLIDEMENWCHVCINASFLVVETFNWFSKQFKLIATANFNSQSIVEIPPPSMLKTIGNWTFQCLVLSITWEVKVMLGVDICWNKFWNPLWFREPEFCTNFNGSSNEFKAIPVKIL